MCYNDIRDKMIKMNRLIMALSVKALMSKDERYMIRHNNLLRKYRCLEAQLKEATI